MRSPRQAHPSIAINKSAYNPPVDKIKAKYFEKYRGQGGDGLDDVTTGPSVVLF